MKFSLEWLKAYLDTEANVHEVAARLNEIGFEVEGIEDPAQVLDGFVVAQVLTAAPHPAADKLQVLTVEAGTGAPLQVVCGAPNARAGMKGVLGLSGAVVPANGMQLKKAQLRGVESNGMMCSVRELELGEDHNGIIELPGDAPVGTPFAEYHGASPVIDISVNPNRPDCMGVYGIARDLAAAGLGGLKPLEEPAIAGDYPCPVEVRTDDPQGCPAFYGRVIRGVTNGASPEWMQQRLASAGQRPISALVDATNYVMLAYGRPAHAYDLARLNGAVVARRARAGEQVEALNEKTYTLDPSMTVIADDAGVHDIAGIMGGQDSGCTEATTDILLEIAYFDRESIGRTGRELGLASDARSRFERGVDPAFLDHGMALLTDLILRTCGGVASDVVRAGAAPAEPKVVRYDPALCARLGGVEIAGAEQRRILAALDFTVADDWQVTAPARRHDIEGAADIVEEVVRIHGLDRVESVALPRADGVARPTATPMQVLERRLRRAAAASGLNEAITWSFLPTADAEAFAGEGEEPWMLANPISEDMKAMRPSLLPGLLAATRRNFDRGASALRLFEIGRRYLRAADGLSDERPTLAVVLAGERTARGWSTGKASNFDAFDAKALALALLEEAGAPVARLQVMPVHGEGENGGARAQFHPGQSASLRLGPKTVLARFGIIHPALAKVFDIDVPVAMIELFLDAIPAKKAGGGFARAAYAPPALQAVTRDFAFLVPEGLPASDLVRAVQGADKANIVDVRLFDAFAGTGVPEGQKSLAVEVTLQPKDKSFTDDELKAIGDKVTQAAAKTGAKLRG